MKKTTSKTKTYRITGKRNRKMPFYEPHKPRQLKVMTAVDPVPEVVYERTHENNKLLVNSIEAEHFNTQFEEL